MPIETSFQNENVLSNDEKSQVLLLVYFNLMLEARFLIGQEGHQCLIVQASVKVQINKVLAIKIKAIIPPAYQTPT